MNRETEKLLTGLSRSADEVTYNINKCWKIKNIIKHKETPKLTLLEMESLKQHLTGYTKITNTEMPYTFLNLRNIFILLKEFEERPDLLNKITSIIEYLKEFDHVFEIIQESMIKKSMTKVDTAINILNIEINRFCMKYSGLLNEIDPTSPIQIEITSPTIDFDNIRNKGE